MNNRQNPLFWSFPLGNWFETQVQVSVFFPLLALILCLKFGLLLGGTFTLVLFASVLWHEFGHVRAARSTGGHADEILIWPLGGLASAVPGPTFGSKFLTAAAGPLANLVLCLVTLWPVLASTSAAAAWHPLEMPDVDLRGDTVNAVMVLIFAANWLQLLVNLLPVYPLDGGRMLQCVLSRQWDGDQSSRVYLRIGFLVALAIMLAGLLLTDGLWLVALGAILLVLNMHESVQLQTSERCDESFMGYDFSQGYTSLERSTRPPREERRPGFFQRWREQRRQRREQLEQQRRIEAEQQLDAILEKVHAQGIGALSEGERRILDQASDRYRDRRNRESH